MWHSPSSLRANNLDAMRFTLAMLVVLSHCWEVLYGGGTRSEPLVRWTHFPEASMGGLAVDGFFIISGFLVTMSWEHTGDWLKFLGKRAARIYPGFIVATLLGAFVVAPLAMEPGYAWFSAERVGNALSCCVRLREYFVPGTFLHNPFRAAINGSVWTIGYEFRCYLLIMALGLLTLLRRRWYLLAAWLLALGLYLWAYAPSFGIIGSGVFANGQAWPRFLVMYFAGTLFYLFRKEIPASLPLALVAALLLIFGSTFPSAPTPHFVRGFGYRLLMPTCGTYLLFFLAFQPWLTVHRFAKYGDFSYGIYLFSFPIQQLLVFWALKQNISLNPFTFFLVSAPMSILAGILSWHLVEKRFLRNKTHTVPRPYDQPTPPPPSLPLASAIPTPITNY